MLVSAEAEEAVMAVEGRRAIVLGVNQEREGRDFGGGGALGCVPEESATKAAAAEVLIDCKPAETGGGHARIAGQPAGCRLRQVAQEHGAHRQRVVAGDLTCRPLQSDEARAHPPTRVLSGLAVEVAIERLDTAYEGPTLMVRREPFDNEGALHR